MLKPKQQGQGLDVKTFQDESDRTYVVYRYPTKSGANSYHVFAEVEAQQVARELGVDVSNTVSAWNELWSKSDGH